MNSLKAIKLRKADAAKMTSIVAVFFLSLFVQSPLCAEGLNELSIHGFLSQGYLLSDVNNYLVESSQGSAEFSEVGATLSVAPLDRLRLGLQILARDLGDEGNSDMFLDWGYADYHWRDYLGFRIGKIKTPLGLYNKHRDLDLLRQSVLLPESVYGEGIRDFILASDGIGLYGFKPFPGFGDLEYELQAGSRNIPNPYSQFWNSQFETVGDQIADAIEESLYQNPTTPPGTVDAIFNETNDRRVFASNSLLGSLIWSPPVKNLRLAGAYMLMPNVNVTGNSEILLAVSSSTPGLQPPAYTMFVPIQSFVDVAVYALSAEYSIGGLLLASEYLRTHYDLEIRTMTSFKTDNTSDGFYGSAAYQLNPWFALGGYYSEYYSDVDDREGKQRDRAADAWQKEIVVNTRFDITPFWISKIEFHVCDGFATVAEPEGFDDRSRHWVLLALKNTFHF